MLLYGLLHDVSGAWGGIDCPNDTAALAVDMIGRQRGKRGSREWVRGEKSLAGRAARAGRAKRVLRAQGVASKIT